MYTKMITLRIFKFFTYIYIYILYTVTTPVTPPWLCATDPNSSL